MGEDGELGGGGGGGGERRVRRGREVRVEGKL